MDILYKFTGHYCEADQDNTLRIPFMGDVSISYSEGFVIKARAIDIYEVGLGIEDYSNVPINTECEITVAPGA